MRQIKFRGLGRNNNKEWHYGFYAYNAFTNEHRIMTSSGNYSVVNPDTIGEFTGEYDDDGKEIYEGDITERKVKVIGNIHEGEAK